MNLSVVLIKPEAVKRNLTGPIIQTIENHDFVIGKLIKVRPTVGHILAHYAEHTDKSFFPDLLGTMVCSDLVAMVVGHTIDPHRTVEIMRRIVGPYKDRIPGTLRGRFALDDRNNAIHASDSHAAAFVELGIWFPGAY